MSNKPMVVFVTTCKGRLQHLRETLPKNLVDNLDYPNCRFVVLAYCDSDEDLDDFLRWTMRGQGPCNLTVYSYRGGHEFKMAHAKNMAHRCGILEGADILVNLDADNFTGPGFAKYVAKTFTEARDEILMWAKWNQSGPTVGSRIPKGCGGRIAVTKNTFWKAGGYDEAKYSTWGPDDKDFHHRLRRLGVKPVQIDGKYLNAVLHNDRMRFREYPHARTAMDSGQFEAVHDSEATVANWGQVGCGVVVRSAYSKAEMSPPIELKPIPTRIFGVGIHKTATTSLHHALRILGYDSAHWENAHWARSIWEEINTPGRQLTAEEVTGLYVGSNRDPSEIDPNEIFRYDRHRSATLERHYALSDLPIALFYRELDHGYPGSKFVLTVRDEAKWIDSVERHWSRENPFRGQWDTDPFTHRVHKALYGRKAFDREIFVTRYRRHNAEVREYFRDRPDDLLVMEMDGGAGWSELCGFLGRDVPAVRYPRAFITKGEKS